MNPGRLSPGSRLGPYEVVSPIGAGGMGEVWKARDTRLERTVAVKVLPQKFSASEEVKRRFEREAKAIAQLSHPHICALYDVGREGETEYLVMEYLEGETLADRLAKGALPLERTLRFGIQITDALDKAHRQGIVHRDLKPGNVMLTRSGVKLLDFGLAHAVAPAAPVGSLSVLPTQDKPLTAEGTILGTVQYMAPEQLEGKAVDARTDIFAFGATLFEMATGRKAFIGRTQASLIAAIMSSEPPAISTLQPMAPPSLDRVVRKCLLKDPEGRWQSAADIGSELKWVAEETSTAAIPSFVSPRRPRERLVWAFAGALAGGLVVALALWSSMQTARPALHPGARLAVTLPAEEPIDYLPSHVLALSPDGSRLVYIGKRGETRQIFLRPIDQWDAVPIPGTEGASNPFFSPDGQWVAFFSEDNKLKKVSLGGGLPVTLCSTSSPLGGSWGPDDTIVFTRNFTSGLWKISAKGGTPKEVTSPDVARNERVHIWPQLLPGEKAVLFTIWMGVSFDDARIAVADLETGRVRILFEGGSDARYLPSGHLVYARGGSLLAVPFDAARLQVTGPPVTVLPGVLSSGVNGESQIDVSLEGSLAYLPGGVRSWEKTLVWVDRRGASVPVSETRKNFASPHLSPDGGRLAVTVQGGTFDIWVYEIGRGVLTRLSFGADDSDALWARDGKRVVWSSSRGGQNNLFWRAADASTPEERLTTSQHPQFPYSFSPDGKALLLLDIDPSTGEDLWIMPLEGDKTPRPFVRTPFREHLASFSPDGGWIAYSSDESGREEVYVAPYPGGGGKVQVTPAGGTEPAWSPKGHELFYRQDDRMMAVPVETRPSLQVGKPVVLFAAKYDAGYDVSPDGQRFLMVKKSEEQALPAQINIVLDWLDELRRSVPLGKGH